MKTFIISLRIVYVPEEVGQQRCSASQLIILCLGEVPQFLAGKVNVMEQRGQLEGWHHQVEVAVASTVLMHGHSMAFQYGQHQFIRYFSSCNGSAFISFHVSLSPTSFALLTVKDFLQCNKFAGATINCVFIIAIIRLQFSHDFT